jgi:hypothetical protein
MKKWLERLCGAIGMGLTWAVGWTLVGMLRGSNLRRAQDYNKSSKMLLLK